jgi:glycosyltransferase involved in cell wall biosynthesis
MDRGGIETWLMQVLRNRSRDRFRMDFLVHTDQRCAYDDEIRSIGSDIFPCPNFRRPWLYTRDFLRILREQGTYDIVHVHGTQFGGLILLLARMGGVPNRIVHCHIDTSWLSRKSSAIRKPYLALMARWIRKHSTAGLSPSGKAARAAFGKSWEEDGRWQVVHCGVDLTPFKERPDARAVRTELGIPHDAFVIGHVGRFTIAKNHRFMVEVFAEVEKLNPKARLLLIGDGGLYKTIKELVERRGLSDKVLFLGSRPDVPRLLMSGMDRFLFPSLFEGLGLALVEAQAAGLPCVISDAVPREAEVVNALISRVAIDQPAAVWAKAVMDKGEGAPAVPWKDALAAVQGSPFELQRSLESLELFYDGMVQKH